MVSPIEVVNVIAATFIVYLASALAGCLVTLVPLLRDGYGLLPEARTPALTNTRMGDAVKLHVGVCGGLMVCLLAIEGAALAVAGALVVFVGIPVVSVTLPIFFIIPIIRLVLWLGVKAFGYRLLPVEVPPHATGRLLGYYVVAATVVHAVAFFLLFL